MRKTWRLFILVAAAAVLTAPSPPAPATPLRLGDEVSDPALRRDVLAVCRDVLALYQSTAGDRPPLGPKPIVVRQAPDGVPRACLDDLPRDYRINLTCASTRYYSQIVFQFAHELGHVYIDPRTVNWFIESTCTAMSYVCLAELGEKWKRRPPFPKWASYAPDFLTYRERDIQGALEAAGLHAPDRIPRWVKEDLPALVRDGQVGRTHQRLAAVLIEQALCRHPESWGALLTLGAASDRGRTDFDRWAQLVAPDDRPLVDDLAAAFAPVAPQSRPSTTQTRPAEQRRPGTTTPSVPPLTILIPGQAVRGLVP